jgi:inositol transport system ATP-binding protein
MIYQDLLKAENITKTFPGVKALDNVQLTISKGKVHALMGENGAGKSTFMKILIGLLTADSGDIFFKGKKIHFSNVHEAMKEGISMIHQELMPFPHLSVAENIFMGNEPVKKIKWFIDKKKMKQEAALLMERLGAKINVNTLMKELTIAEMQLVEIAKAISNKAQLIIMDEPTSAISDREVNMLFNLIHELKEQGIAVIYISHKMDEILNISDTITIMRDGKYVGTYDKNNVDNSTLITLIVGREIKSVFNKKSITAGEEILSVKNLSGKKFKNINFQIRRGEILGFAGLMGSGRTEIVNALFGLDKITGGEIFIKGKKIKKNLPGKAIENSIGLVSEDRTKFGLILNSSIKENITLSSLKRFTNGIFIDNNKENKIVDQLIQQLRIKTSSRNQLVKFLSGGNQQKVVLAKVLLNEPDIIILDEPTRGIDIGAKKEVYDLIYQLASDGKAIIMVSSELPEILGLSDRIIVIHDGELKTELKREDASQEIIMKYAMT